MELTKKVEAKVKKEIRNHHIIKFEPQTYQLIKRFASFCSFLSIN